MFIEYTIEWDSLDLKINFSSNSFFNTGRIEFLLRLAYSAITVMSTGYPSNILIWISKNKTFNSSIENVFKNFLEYNKSSKYFKRSTYSII